MPNLKFQVLEGGTLPTRATEESAGLDLYSPIDFVIPPCEVVGRAVNIGCFKVDIRVAVELPKGHKGDVRPRSGLAFNRSVPALLGTIDSDYRQSINVLLYNFTAYPVQITKGDRIAQFVVTKVELLTPVAADIENTDRGGLGSTGK